MAYAKESARQMSYASSDANGFDMAAFADIMLETFSGMEIRNVTQLDGRTVAEELVPFVDGMLGSQQRLATRGVQ